MVSQNLLKELEIILEKQLQRKPTAEEVSEYARSFTEYFELAGKIEQSRPAERKFLAYFWQFNNIADLEEWYGKSSNTGQSVQQGTGG